MSPSPNPTLYQVNLRVLLRDRSRAIGRPATLDDMPDAARRGRRRSVRLALPARPLADRPRLPCHLPIESVLGAEFAALLPDLTDDDIAGSSFALVGAVVPDAIGGDEAAGPPPRAGWPTGTSG